MTGSCLSFCLNKEVDSMGKGDRKTRRGKIFRGSYGKTRPRHPKPDESKPERQRHPAGRQRGKTR